ncbi:putative 57 kDa heat shock protein [Cardamine amara subsp. amara]|uniref:57 kDa heat shock protein n=1 Tax=Cardamine amara subsp. amara TaxID=228776 RepID=A0ABD1C729_CARAN
MSAYETKRLSKGGLFLRIDMPGVPKDSFVVAVDGDGYVTVMGRAPATMHDLSGRHYVGKVAIVPRGYDGRQIKVNAKDGVVRLIIRP